MAFLARCVSAFLVTLRPRLAPSSLIGRRILGLPSSSDFAMLTTDESLCTGIGSTEAARGGAGLREVVRDLLR